MKKLIEHAKEIELRLLGLTYERDTLAEEVGNFANFLEGIGYSSCEIDNVANGWLTDRVTNKDKRIKELEHKIMMFMNVANDTNEEK